LKHVLQIQIIENLFPRIDDKKRLVAKWQLTQGYFSRVDNYSFFILLFYYLIFWLQQVLF